MIHTSPNDSNMIPISVFRPLAENLQNDNIVESPSVVNTYQSGKQSRTRTFCEFTAVSKKFIQVQFAFVFEREPDSTRLRHVSRTSSSILPPFSN